MTLEVIVKCVFTPNDEGFAVEFFGSHSGELPNMPSDAIAQELAFFLTHMGALWIQQRAGANPTAH